MTLNLKFSDLEVKSERTQIDRAFFNRRYRAVFDELLRLDAEVGAFGATESTLVSLGLDRLNVVLGPLLGTLQEAAELGFLVCYSIGDSHSLVLGEAIGWHITEGAALFTPTPFVMAQDMTDITNWGVLLIDEDGWHKTTGELATHVAYTTKTKSSTQWSISASSATPAAMQQMLTETKVYAQAAQAAQISVDTDMAQLQGLINALQTGAGVASVNTKTGIVSLTTADIPGTSGQPTLDAQLAAKTSLTYVTSQLTGKQDANSKLTVLANVAWSANKLLMATGGATIGTQTISEFAKGLIDDLDISEAQSTLGISAFAKTILDDTSAAAVRTTLGIAAAPDVPVKASAAEVATGTDDLKFVTSLGLAGTLATYQPKIAGINTQNASYTLLDADNGKVIRFTSAIAVTRNLPASAPVGYSALIEQGGVGQVTINVVTNATRNSYLSKFKTAGTYATAAVYCSANSDGAHAVWNVSGNLVA